MKKEILFVVFLVLYAVESFTQIYNIGLIRQVDVEDGRGVHTTIGNVFVADGTAGVKIYDYALDSLTLVSSFDTDGDVRSIFADQNYVFIADGIKGIKSYYIANIAAPIFADSLQIGQASFVNKSGNTLFAIVDNNLVLIDVSYPGNMSVISTYDVVGNAIPQSISILYNAVYLAENGSDGGLEVIDITNPTQPVRSAFFTYAGFCYDATIALGLLTVTEGFRIHKYLIDTPLLPVQVASDSVGGKPSQITQHGDIMVYLDGKTIKCDPDPMISNSYVHSYSVSYIYGGSEFSSGSGPLFTVGDSLKEFFILVTDVNETPNDEMNFLLAQNYPNPFNPSTTINFNLPYKAKVKLSIYNQLGEVERVLLDEEKFAGKYSVKFDAEGLPSGVYFYTLSAGSFIETKKFIIMR